MSKKSNNKNPFSLIVDFDGDFAQMIGRPIPEELPILPMKGMILFPVNLISIAVNRPSSRRLIEMAVKKDLMFGVVTQKNSEVEAPKRQDLYDVGVAAKVLQQYEMPDGSLTVILQGYGKFALGKLANTRSYMRGEVLPIPEVIPEKGDSEYSAAVSNCRDEIHEFLRYHDSLPEEIVMGVANIHNPVFFVNFLCTNLPLSLDEKYALLCENDLKRRAYQLLPLLGREVQYMKLKHDIARNTHQELDKQQREYFLQQQVKNIQEELGDSVSAEAKNLREKLQNTEAIPEATRKLLTREIDKLETLNQRSPDYNVQLDYLTQSFALPWGTMSEDNLDIRHARRQLDHDHYGLDKVKDRIIEQLALMQLSGSRRMPILCLYGPPGVGKTSLGRSIAAALGRKYVRVSLAGVHDESEIRGHRRTYVAAMAGRIMKSIVRAETDNPVFVLDEIDKVTANMHHGDPQSALLEVLDPEQNKQFHDNYFDFDYDLSHVLFIATANTLQGIPAPLLDRMELINVEGYLTEEKKEIAKHHLIPRELSQLELDKKLPLKLSPAAIEYVIEKYTRESGVRQLAKQINKIVRKLAVKAVSASENGETYDFKALKPKELEEMLGVPPFNRDIYQGNDDAGVVTGLAWTSVGGEILFIETSLSRTKAARLTITGNLGDVMKESVMLAMEYVKAHAEELGVDFRLFEQWGVHVHVPEGATPKDGPSAGITIATSIASAVTQRKVRAHVAMTGEITLRGKVLPVGGIKEKILAAKRAGITDIIMCKDNRRNVEDIPEQYRRGLMFHYVDTVSDVWKIALLPEKVKNPLNLTIEESCDK